MNLAKKGCKIETTFLRLDSLIKFNDDVTFIGDLNVAGWIEIMFYNTTHNEYFYTHVPKLTYQWN